MIRKRSLAKMIVGINFLIALANFSTVLTVALGIIINTSAYSTTVIAIISNILLFAAHDCSILVYYNFSRMYRDTFKRVLKKLIWIEIKWP